MKMYTQMTTAEREDAVRFNELLNCHADAVKARETALDTLAAYLKTSRRKRTAPTMLYQYVAFDHVDFRKLVADVERLTVIEEAASDALYQRAKARNEAAS